MIDFISIKEVKQNIGAWCRTMRKAENLTKQDLAVELQLSRFTIAKLENGENPTLETLLKVLHYFDGLRLLNDFVTSHNQPVDYPESLY